MNKIIMFLPLLLLAACGPKTYEDCVIENVKEVNNNAAVCAIRQACAKKFPPVTSSEPETTSTQEPEAAAPAAAMDAAAPAFDQ